MKLLLLCFFFLINSNAFGQANSKAYPDFHGMTLTEVLDIEGWIVIDQAKGNFYTDQNEDTVVILQSGKNRFEGCNESADLLADEERIILVLTSNDGEPKVTIQNNDFIARPDEGGMLCYLIPSVSIKDNQLQIYYEFVRSHWQHNFEYLNNELVLVSAKNAGVSGPIFFSDYYDFRKKVITSEEGDIQSEDTTVEVIPMKVDGFKKLSELGKMYEWEVADRKNI